MPLLLQVLDYGYPQNCSTDVLKLYITQQVTAASRASRDSYAAHCSRRWIWCLEWLLNYARFGRLLLTVPFFFYVIIMGRFRNAG